jgi:hypothetical protein
MPKQSAAARQAYEKVVNLRLAALKSLFPPLEQAVLAANRPALKDAANNFAQSYESLGEIFPEDMNPSWLRRVGNHARHFANDAENFAKVKNLIVQVMKARDLIASYDWNYDSTEDETPDVSAILEEEVIEKSVDDIFDKLIKQLSDIVEDDRLDRDRAYEDLIVVLRMLKKARSGNVVDKIVSWEFVKRLLPNIFIQIAKSTPILKQLVSAVDETLQEMDSSLAEVKSCAFDKVTAGVRNSVHMQIESQPSELLLLEHHPPDFREKTNPKP